MCVRIRVLTHALSHTYKHTQHLSHTLSHMQTHMKGCGNSRLSEDMVKAGWDPAKIVSVDFSSTSIEQAAVCACQLCCVTYTQTHTHRHTHTDTHTHTHTHTHTTWQHQRLPSNNYQDIVPRTRNSFSHTQEFLCFIRAQGLQKVVKFFFCSFCSTETKSWCNAIFLF